jgi:hypothetical protein
MLQEHSDPDDAWEKVVALLGESIWVLLPHSSLQLLDHLSVHLKNLTSMDLLWLACPLFRLAPSFELYVQPTILSSTDFAFHS